MPTPVPQGLVPKTTDFADRIRANFKTQSAMTTFGIEMLDVVAGHTRLEMLANDRVLQQQGFVHGGVIAAAMDSACGYAALSLAAADREVLTIEYKVSFIAPAVGERYEFEGQVIKPGRTISFTEGTAFAINGEVRKLVATLNASMAIVAAPDAGRRTNDAGRMTGVCACQQPVPVPASPTDRNIRKAAVHLMDCGRTVH